MNAGIPVVTVHDHVTLCVCVCVFRDAYSIRYYIETVLYSVIKLTILYYIKC